MFTLETEKLEKLKSLDSTHVLKRKRDDQSSKEQPETDKKGTKGNEYESKNDKVADADLAIEIEMSLSRNYFLEDKF